MVPNIVVAKTVIIYNLIVHTDLVLRVHSIIEETIDFSFLWAYFDGDTLTDGNCGGEAILYLSNSHSFMMKICLR